MTDGRQQTLLFDDGKEPEALRTIGEIEAALGIKQHVLRYWEQQFPMLRPLKRSGGRRYYRPGDVELVATIDRLVNREGYTLKGARQALSKGRVAKPEATPAAVAAPALEVASIGAAEKELLAQLHSIRRRLSDALEI